MTIIKVNLHDDGISRNNLSGYNNLTNAATTGVRFADLLDSSGASTGVSLTQNGAFTGDLGASTIATSSPDPDFEFEFFNAYFYAGSSEIAGATFTMAGLPAGASYTLKLSGASDNDTRDTNFTATDGTPSPALYNNVTADPPTAPVTITGTVPGNGQVTISLAIVSTFAYLNGWQIEYTAGSSAAIGNLNTDNSVTTYQQANANGVSGFGGPITSGTLGGEAVTIIDGDWQSNGGVVSLRVPGNLATGTYDLVLSDGTDSATLSGVTFTQEYPYEAPYGLVDSNSDWAGQVLTEGSRWKVTTEFTNITYDYVTGAAETPPFGNDINDHAEADVGYSGDDSQERQVIYGDGATATYTVSVSVGEGGIDVYPFSKSIKYAATKNWTWGKRHPMTSMRVRIFK